MRGSKNSVLCPTCGAAPGMPCRGLSGQVISYVHRARAGAAKDNKRPSAGRSQNAG